MSNTYVAIDFETANSARASACQIGLAKFENGELVDQFETLIRPHSSMNNFDFYNTQIHGITAADVKNSPEFIDVWPVISEFVSGAPLVAHNAGFDMSVLRGLFDVYEIEYPTFDYLCTFMLARNLLKPAELNLGFVAKELGVSLENHHDALSDAIAAGEIAHKLVKRFGVNSIEELSAVARIRAGRFSIDGWRGSATKQTSAGGSDESFADMMARLADQVVSDGPLVGLLFVITGTIPGLTRNQVHEQIIISGGEWGKAVNKKTDFLINGDGVGETNKTRRVYELREKGAEIAIIDPEGFFGMLAP
jgi:DNA polymerase III epsilon subunit-like protein